MTSSNEKTKVVFVSHSGDLRGGAERSLLEIATDIKESVDLCVIVPKKGSCSMLCRRTVSDAST